MRGEDAAQAKPFKLEEVNSPMYGSHVSSLSTTTGQTVTMDVEIVDGEPFFSMQYGEGVDQLIEFDIDGCRQLLAQLGSILGMRIAEVA
ncbi:hypothetical protein BH762_gp110 [Gordonia phage OneUp]|uniref:Uncharacterized protein n=1 Tax=Gordonia phage OneUp TaxID=1838074 RepID=A0A160DEW5_9CAUD|nr:hypothetical protein BH762_gp110 [Gordonia phage OneUp]ANA86409.1 hypothetical protein PBI_ONEUP_75 [Gordonia phage OneUp]